MSKSETFIFKNLFLNEKFVLFIIVLNTITIFIDGFKPNIQLLTVLDIAFTVFFTIEAIIKIRTYGWKKYWSDGWNKLDFIVVVLALPSLAELFIDNADAYNTSVLLALRSFRLLKTLKLFHYLPNFKSLFVGLKLAFKTSFLVLFAFLLFLVIIALLSTTLFGDTAPEYFGNPAVSLYSIFRLFTIEGWYDLPNAIASNSSVAFGVFAKVYFSTLLFAGGIIGVSLINSIFVDAMASDNNDQVIKKLNDLEKKLDQLQKSEETDTPQSQQ